MAKSSVKPLSEEEVRNLFEEAILGVKDKVKAVPQDRFYATLEKAVTDPEWEALIPIMVSLYYSLYVNETSVPVGTGGIKLELADNTVSFVGATNQKMVVTAQSILSNIQKQKDVVTEHHFNFI